MKWTHKNERCVRRFAFLPYENEEEVRWLETVYIWQSYNRWRLFSPWENRCFATKEEYINWKKERKREKTQVMQNTKQCDICGRTYESYGANDKDEKPYCDHVIFMAKDKPMDTLELCPWCMERLCHTILKWGEGETNG